jgi:hypothetical protein
MDSLIAAAARALAAGDALGALKRVALRDDPPALALRGIAMAQLGEHPRARELLRLAARDFGAHEELARARCVVAEAEVALAMRDLGGPASSQRALTAAMVTLQARDDRANALQARLIATRRFLLLGRLDEAADTLAPADPQGLPPALAAVTALATAELALRSLRIGPARAALARLRAGNAWVPLARRPVLFTLARALAEAWPGDVGRHALIATAFRTRHPDETHRARLRVEIGRLRTLVAGLADIEATAQGFALRPRDGRAVHVLAPPIDGDQASLVALLSDGAAWSTSALALALGASQRTVQRALAELQASGQVRSIGQARARRWLSPPLAGFTTILLLPAAMSLA